MRVDFPDGQWAEIYTPGEMPRLVTVRLQDMLAEFASGLSEDDQANHFRSQRDIGRLRDTLMAMVVKNWGYDFERTETAEDMYQLPQDSYDALHEATHEHWGKAGFFEPDPNAKEEEETEKKKPVRKPRAGSTSSD